MPLKFEGLLAKQYDELGTTFQAAWDLYLKFYIAFIALNLTALGIMVQYIDADRCDAIFVSFVAQNLVSAITAICVGLYGCHAAKQQESIIELWRRKPSRGRECARAKAYSKRGA